MNKVYEYVQERIIKALEEAIKEGGTAPWKKPWKGYGFVNYVTRKPYRGINLILLPEPGEYITFNQIQEIRKKNPEVKLKKGCKKHMVVFWSFPNNKKTVKEEKISEITEEIEDIEEIVDEEDIKVTEVTPVTPVNNSKKNKKKPIFRYYWVYNINDVEGLESKFKFNNEHNPIDDAEKIINNYDIELKINKGSDRAFYSPEFDFISVPDKSQYKNIAEYYCTIFHEMVHSTGHKSRLNRFTSLEEYSFASETYSKEELIAEIGANMLMLYAGIENTACQQNSISYLYGWLKAIKEDVTLIISAAQKAQKAADYILNYKSN